MLKKLFLLFILVSFVFLHDGFTQKKRRIEVNAQTIVARVDSIMQYPEGLIKGRLKHIRPDGKVYQIDLTVSVTKEDFLFTFSMQERGDQFKVLYNLGGEEIWVYDIHAVKLYNKMGVDKYEQLLSTNYTFMDLSNADLQSNYTASFIGNARIKGQEVYKLRLDPIFKGSEYGRLTLYVTQDRSIPLRIDYHDRDNAIFKFMTVNKVMEKGNSIIPIRYEMMDIRRGTLTVLWFLSFERNVTFNKKIFRSEKLGE